MFSLEQIDFDLSGHEVGGWSDDPDALSFPNIDIANVKRGAVGGTIASSTGDKGGPVVFKFLANGKTAKFLQLAAMAQLNGVAVLWQGLYRDPVNGVTVACVNGTMTNIPLGPTMGKGDVANKEFTIDFEVVAADYSAANF